MNENFDPMADDPANYKLGIFYFNRKDKRTIVPKRYRLLGWTINFAHPYVYWRTIIIVAIIIFSVVVAL
jgi:uncharacterized membrane protein